MVTDRCRNCFADMPVKDSGCVALSQRITDKQCPFYKTREQLDAERNAANARIKERHISIAKYVK